LALALQKAVEDRLSLSVFSEALQGKDRALVFSQLGPSEFQETVATLLQQSSFMDYARKGTIAPETVELQDGPLLRNDEPVPHTMERSLRQLGLPVVLKKGQLTLEQPFCICQKGDTLSVSQAEALREFYRQFPLFNISIIAHIAI